MYRQTAFTVNACAKVGIPFCTLESDLYGDFLLNFGQSYPLISMKKPSICWAFSTGLRQYRIVTIPSLFNIYQLEEIY